MPRRWTALTMAALVASCSRPGSVGSPAPPPPPAQRAESHADTLAISRIARELSADSLRGRGPWTPENERVARRLASDLERLGAKPLFGNSLLVAFASE